jgi:hypothetical protein
MKKATCLALAGAALLALVVGCSSSDAKGFGAPAPADDATEPSQPAARPGAAPTTPPTPPPSQPTTDPQAQPDGGASPAPDAAPACQDTTPEPGADEGAPLALAAIDDCDKSVASLRGVVAGQFDVDTYKFRGNDTYLCRMAPKAVMSAPGVRLCMFVQCQAGTTNIASCTTGAPATSKTGLKGCCVDGPGEVNIDFDCNGSLDDAADFYMRVDQPNANLCVPYTVTYSL